MSFERLPGHVVLVLDDLRCRSRPSRYTIFWRTAPPLAATPADLLLISRSNPPWPLANVSRQKAGRQIRTRDFRFIPEEAATFSGQGIGDAAQPFRDGIAFDEQLEGWIARMRLVVWAGR